VGLTATAFNAENAKAAENGSRLGERRGDVNGFCRQGRQVRQEQRGNGRQPVKGGGMPGESGR
jgi:hypothetical protein